MDEYSRDWTLAVKSRKNAKKSVFCLFFILLHISSSYAKIWGKQNFSLGSFPKWVKSRRRRKKKKKKMIFFHIPCRNAKIWGLEKRLASWVSPKWVKSRRRRKKEKKKKNTPGTRGWSRLRDRTLAVQKKRAKICFFP